MNEEDKKAFDKWYEENSRDNGFGVRLLNVSIEDIWKAAIEYKEKSENAK